MVVSIFSTGQEASLYQRNFSPLNHLEEDKICSYLNLMHMKHHSLDSFRWDISPLTDIAALMYLLYLVTNKHFEIFGIIIYIV